MPPKKKQKAKLLKKDTDSMVLELKRQEEIVKTVVSKLQTGTEFFAKGSWMFCFLFRSKKSCATLSD